MYSIAQKFVNSKEKLMFFQVAKFILTIIGSKVNLVRYKEDKTNKISNQYLR